METEDLLVERLIRHIDEANTYFLMKMGASVGKIKELTLSQAQQLVQILKYGGNYEEIVNEIAKYTNMNVSEIDEIFSCILYHCICLSVYDQHNLWKLYTTKQSMTADF